MFYRTIAMLLRENTWNLGFHCNEIKDGGDALSGYGLNFCYLFRSVVLIYSTTQDINLELVEWLFFVKRVNVEAIGGLVGGNLGFALSLG